MNLGSTYAALIAAHHVADFWVQTDHQACTKALPGRPGHTACLAHVASYTATAAVFLAAAAAVTGQRPHAGRVLAGLAVSAVSHYVIDRRAPLRWVAERTGKARFYHLGTPRPGRDDNPSLGTGAYALDQASHVAFVYAAALIIAGGRPEGSGTRAYL